MVVTIRRNTGTFFNMSIKVNRQKVAKIANGETKKVEIPSNQATIQVSQQGVSSNKVEAQDGDIYEIKTKSWLSIIYLIFIILLFTAEVFWNPPYIFIAIIAIILIYLITIFSIDFYSLQKVN